MRHERASEKDHQCASRSVLRVVGGAVLVLAAVGIIYSLNDIRRYVNMVRM